MFPDNWFIRHAIEFSGVLECVIQLYVSYHQRTGHWTQFGLNHVSFGIQE
jgi:hypothetical protein